MLRLAAWLPVLLSAIWAQVPVQGGMKLTLYQAVFPGEGGGNRLELSYSVPFTSLTFTRGDEGYRAGVRIGVQILDKGRHTVGGDVWERTVRVKDYAATGARDSVVAGVAELELPANGTQVRVEVVDVASERQGWAAFAVAVPAGRIALRAMKSGATHPGRGYGVGDTIVVMAELPATGSLPDSVRFTAGRGARTVLGASAAVAESAGRRRARFEYPVADSVGSPRLGSGEYWIEASAAAEGGAVLVGRTTFRVELPFFYDDSAYQAKVDQLVHVATVEEMRRLRAAPRPERERAWAGFWQPKDTNPSTARNEAEEEYFERIEYAEEHFRAGDRGYRSDRASVYVRYGPPDQIESLPFDIERPAEQTWSYYATGMRFRFVDRFGSGTYLLSEGTGTKGGGGQSAVCSLLRAEEADGVDEVDGAEQAAEVTG